jgi:hypothetical protein
VVIDVASGKQRRPSEAGDRRTLNGQGLSPKKCFQASPASSKATFEKIAGSYAPATVFDGAWNRRIPGSVW